MLILLVWYNHNLYSPEIYPNNNYAYMNYARVMFTELVLGGRLVLGGSVPKEPESFQMALAMFCFH